MTFNASISIMVVTKSGDVVQYKVIEILNPAHKLLEQDGTPEVQVSFSHDTCSLGAVAVSPLHIFLISPFRQTWIRSVELY